MNNNKRMNPFASLFVILMFSVALFGLSSVAWGAITVTTTFESDDDEAVLACLSLGGPYTAVDLTDPTVVENGRDMVITVAALADLTSGETITITLPSTNLEWDATVDATWFTDAVAGASLTIARTSAQVITLTAGGNATAGGTITMNKLIVRAVSTVTSAVATAQVNLGGTADIGAGVDCGNIAVAAGPAVTFTDPVASDGADTTSANGYCGLSDAVIANYVWASGIALCDLWISTDSSLVDVSEGERLMTTADALITDIAEGTATSTTISTKGLAEGTYYIYATSNQTGNIKVGRSDALVVTHRPYASYVSPATSDTTLDSGGLIGIDGVADGTGASETADIHFTVVDYDDNATVRLYYGASGLAESDVTTSGDAGSGTLAITGLGTATLVANSDTLWENEDSSINWDIYTSAASYVTAGDYKMYAVVCDGKHYDVVASGKEFYVRHSPSITLDNVDNQTPDTKTERYVTISWGQTGVDGDKDIDDSATIALYYNTVNTFTVGQATAFLADGNTELITSGIAEDPDGRTDNQYVWDLWTFTGTVPTDGVAYYVYAIISDGKTSATKYLDLSTNSITFTHGTWARLKNPVDAGSTVNEGESYRFNWEDQDLDGSLYVKLILVSDGTDALVTAAGAVDYADIDGVASDAYIVCSSDGSWANGTGPTENNEDDYFDFKPEWLQGDVGEVGTGATVFTDDTYYVYLCLSSTDATTEPADADLIFKAPGTLTVSGMAGTPVAYGLEMTPTNAVVAEGDTVTFSIYANANSATVKTMYAYISADTTYWTVVDQNTSTSGTQPFAIGASYTSSKIVENDTHGDAVTDGLYHLDFSYFDNAGITADGTTVLATFRLACKGGLSGANEVDTDVNFDQESGRETAFYNGVDKQMCSVPAPAAVVKVMRRGTLAGRVPLQGRESNYSKEVTFSLRKKGSFEPITDATYLSANDTNSDVAGVQITTGTDGSFQLTEIPSGVYTLVAHTDGYLDGQKEDITVDPGDNLTGQDPTYDAAGTSDLTKLLGGDCAGYTDTSGTIVPDNQIDATDRSAISDSSFDSHSGDSNWNAYCDIDGDGHVYTSDLNMVTANSGVSGVTPTYKLVAGDNERASFSVGAPERVQAGEVFDVVVRSQNIADVRAYSLRLQYDGLRLVGTEEGSFLNNAAPATFVSLDKGREVVLASAIIGRMNSARMDDEVAVLRFRSLKSGAPRVRISEAEVFDSADQRTAIKCAAETSLPGQFALSEAFPNPFNPTVSLSVQLYEETNVSLNVFDVLGRKVATVESGRMNPGFHMLSWDGRNNAGHAVASGLYFFEVNAGAVQEVRKAMLLR